VQACSKDEVDTIDTINETQIQYSAVLDLKDVIGTLDPWVLLDEPNYKSVAEVSHLNPTNRVMLYRSGEDVYVYSLTNMYVEVINDIIDGRPISITYCPQTMSGICWDRLIDGDTMSLAASGLLYRENQMPYDYQTNSIFSQMLQVGVRGKYLDREINTFPLIETNWQMVLDHFPNAFVYSNEGDGNATQKMEVQSEEMYYGVLNRNRADLFTSRNFDADDINVVNRGVASQGLSIIGSKNRNFVVAYKSGFEMQAIQNEFPIVMIDETGSKWNLFGEAVSGERIGQKLEAANGYMALGWAWKDLFDEVVLQ
jgi:hypothetical protein